MAVSGYLCCRSLEEGLTSEAGERSPGMQCSVWAAGFTAQEVDPKSFLTVRNWQRASWPSQTGFPLHSSAHRRRPAAEHDITDPPSELKQPAEGPHMSDDIVKECTPFQELGSESP